MQNSIRLRFNYIEGSKAKGAFVSIMPIFESDTALPILKIVPYSNKDILVPEIPAGLYRILTYDIEENGLLSMPFTEPAVIRTAVVLGNMNITSGAPRSNTLSIVYTISHLILKISCIYSGTVAFDNCLVILRMNQHPERLNVKLHPINSSYPLEYTVDAEASYTITVFTVNRNGILNSTISSVHILIGRLPQIQFSQHLSKENNSYVHA